MPHGQRMFSVDKFFGLNESEDGATELKMGESPKMVNFTITDGFNLKLRPGIRRLDFDMVRDPAPIIAAWAGYIGDDQFLVVVDIKDQTDRIWLYKEVENGYSLFKHFDGALRVTDEKTAFTKVFSFAGKLYIMSAGRTVLFNGETFEDAKVYTPTVIIASAPSGGGEKYENLNMLCSFRKIEFSADGEATEFKLPDEAIAVTEVEIDNVSKPPAEYGTFDAVKHTFTFSGKPVKGVSNVKMTYDTDHTLTKETTARLARMRLTEAYNGPSDTRLFMAGDGSDIVFYSGVPAHGTLEELYFPGMNEIKVDMSGSPVTGLMRHYGKLLIFKPDGVWSVSYGPTTLTGGEVIAGFHMQAASKDMGNDLMGQVQTVDNFPRSITHGNIYDWKITSSYYQDERNHEKVSERVEKTFRNADYSRIVTCDDSRDGSYYVFLNDAEGTVLVHRYHLGKYGAWCIYRSEICKNIRYAMPVGNHVVFMTNDDAFYFSKELTMDAAPIIGRTAPVPINAYWESGYMSFAEPTIQKYSSYIYASVLPEAHTALQVTAETDRRQKYMEKLVVRNLFSFANLSFKGFTFNTNTAPRIARIRLKVKKFVYYKLVFKVETPGANATVLGIDQQIRYGSYAK